MLVEEGKSAMRGHQYSVETIRSDDTLAKIDDSDCDSDCDDSEPALETKRYWKVRTTNSSTAPTTFTSQSLSLSVKTNLP